MKYGIKKKREKRCATWILLAAMLIQAVIPIPGRIEAAPDGRTATPGNALSERMDMEKATSAIAQRSLFSLKQSITGDLWEDWGGTADFPGEGTEDIPYQISTLSQLMGLSESVAAGNTYEGEYFELTQDLDLGGFTVNGGNWNPIGWYQNEDEMDGAVSHCFQGTFDGRGNTIRGLKITDFTRNLRNVGLFGAIDGGTVKHLTVEADDICGIDQTAVLAGTICGDAVIYDVTVSGYLHGEKGDREGSGKGNAGGIAGLADGRTGRVTIENCRADGIVIHSEGSEGYVGGIAGEVHRADLVDNTVYTQDGTSDRIQGKGYTGGIAGCMDRSNLYNSYVDGTIGGNGTKAVGGIVGKYESGNLVLARFAGDISRTNNGTSACEGTFVGTRDSRAIFTYGTEKDNHISYLFTNTAGKARNVFGSRIDGDNSYTKSAHIGYWTDNETRYSIVSGTTETPGQTRCFYEELEDGVRSIITRKLGNEFTAEGAAKDLRFRLDHFAPGYQGEPVAGYLLSVPRIDAKNANGTYDTDVAILTALPNGNQSYYRTIDKNHGAAVAPGIAVTVVTAPKNTEENRYQMAADESEEGGVKPPTYIDESGRRVPMNYVAGGSYSFIMPKRDTEINVEYRKVTTRLDISPEELELSVIHTRTGDRKHPDTTTEVRNTGGTLIARYLNGAPDASVEIQPVAVHGEHNSFGDTADRTMKWSVDDPDLLHLTAPEGYTTEDARILPNLTGSFIQEILNREIQIQADSQYQEAIKPVIYERNAVVTAAANPETSADRQPVYGNCRVAVKFQILDQTTRRVEGLNLNRSDITYTITRTLTGDRISPTENYTCTEPVVLSAQLFPEQPFYKNVTWKDKESGQIAVLSPGGSHGENCSIGIRFDPEGKANPAWIQNVINEDNQRRKEDPYRKLEGSASCTETVTATSEDQTHGIVSADCHITIQFVTVDKTVIHPETVEIDKKQVSYQLSITKEGDIDSDTVKESGFVPTNLNVTVSPLCPEDETHSPYDSRIQWSVSDSDALEITSDGTITPRKDSNWIKETMKKPPYRASKTVFVSATAKDNGISDTVEVILDFSAECIEFQQKKAAFDLTLTKTGRRSNPTFSWSGTEAKQNPAVSYPEEKEIVYHSSNPEILTVSADGDLTPVIDLEQEWVRKAQSYPYTSTKTVEIFAANGTSTDSCIVTLNIKTEDRTTSSGGSSGGGSGSGLGGPGNGGGSSTGVTPAGSKTAASAPSGSVTGTWVQTADGSWTFTSGGRTYNNEWAYIHNPYADSKKGQQTADWFRFSVSGHMVTGWFVDQDGNTYYLNPVSDNTKGRMVTGWNWILGTDGRYRCYYFKETSDGTKGALVRNAITPDGYVVNADGAWIVNQMVQVMNGKP